MQRFAHQAAPWAPRRPRLAWPVVLLAHAGLLASWPLGLQRAEQPAQPEHPGGALVWARPLAAPAPPALAARPPRLATAPPLGRRAATTPQDRDQPRAPAPTPPAAPPLGHIATPAEPIPLTATGKLPDPGHTGHTGDQPGNAGTAQPAARPSAPLNLALPALPGRVASRPPSAWAAQDPRLPVPATAGERFANTLGTDTRLRSTEGNNGARRWQSGRHCVDTRPARDSQINPFDSAAQRLPHLAQGC